jgi:hypothetical protein
LLKALGTKLPDGVLDQDVPMPPVTDPKLGVRPNLLKAEEAVGAAVCAVEDAAVDAFVVEAFNQGAADVNISLGTKLPDGVLDQDVPMPPVTDPKLGVRPNLLKARAPVAAMVLLVKKLSVRRYAP